VIQGAAGHAARNAARPGFEPAAGRRAEARGADWPLARLVLLAEQVFAVLALVLSTSAWSIVGRLTGRPSDVINGDPREQMIWLGIYGLSLLLMVVRPAATLRHGAKLSLIGFLMLWASASIAWSAAPAVSLKRVIALLGTTAFGLYLATRFTKRELFQILLWVTVLSAIASLAVIVLLPAYGMHIAATGGQEWQGIYGQKNWLGRMMAFGSVLWMLHALDRRTRHRLIAGAIAALCLVLAVGSQSKTALVVLIVMLLFIPLIRMWRLHYSLMTVAMMATVIMGGVAGTWAVDRREELLGLLGRNDKLSGRSQLWQVIFNRIEQHPWRGYGYGGFWLGNDGPSRYVWQRVTWLPPNAHNGFLDLWLELGLVGLSVMVVSLVTCAIRAGVIARRDRTVEGAFGLIFLVFLLMANVTESYLVFHNSIFWVLYVTMAADPRQARPAALRSGDAEGAVRRDGPRRAIEPADRPPVLALPPGGP
jgi:O-antigen ligase